ncbi:NmrA family transcriptional regulator [Solwaraspora sp. WMMD1047]|uniref:NmrA family NAD(P)-binding protein n=1 Tax=Solwaraspora sp. WMMD1047 TaxID=3016102 RepID=UPI002417817A|nr:NmrA family transcriptional regulator [Solwaraspora sp. WMMD1047]MDG4831124.1 NmrA family transcriptional regulator [Solwaraspora sp. WMMD1047]
MTSDNDTILVTAGTGKTGRRVAERLTARGLPVRIGSRAAEPPFDWSRPEGWPDVLRGVGSAYLVYYPDLAFPGAAKAVGEFTELAVAAGVRRLVLLSGRGEPENDPAEQAVRDCGAEWTIVRPSWFAQNFSEDFLVEPVRRGVLALPAVGVPEPFVDAEDIADVVTAALTGPGHAGQVYELTGPRLLTFADATAEIGRAAGREVRFEPVSPTRYAHVLADLGMPAEVAVPLTELFTRVLDGRNAHLADGVQRALGREPRDFAEYARRAAATGVWNPGESR